MEVIQRNQPATRELTDHPREWCHIEDPVLVSAALRSGHSQVDLDDGSLHCHCDYIIHEPTGQWQATLLPIVVLHWALLLIKELTSWQMKWGSGAVLTEFASLTVFPPSWSSWLDRMMEWPSEDSIRLAGQDGVPAGPEARTAEGQWPQQHPPYIQMFFRANPVGTMIEGDKYGNKYYEDKQFI